MNLEQEENIKFSMARIDAAEKGFLLDEFTGFVLIEIESGADLYFGSLSDLEDYLNTQGMTDAELKAHYGFVTDGEI